MVFTVGCEDGTLDVETGGVLACVVVVVVARIGGVAGAGLGGV